MYFEFECIILTWPVEEKLKNPYPPAHQQSQILSQKPNTTHGTWIPSCLQHNPWPSVNGTEEYGTHTFKILNQEVKKKKKKSKNDNQPHTLLSCLHPCSTCLWLVTRYMIIRVGSKGKKVMSHFCEFTIVLISC